MVPEILQALGKKGRGQDPQALVTEKQRHMGQVLGVDTE